MNTEIQEFAYGPWDHKDVKRKSVKGRIIRKKNPNKSKSDYIQYRAHYENIGKLEDWEKLCGDNYDELPVLESGDIIVTGKNDFHNGFPIILKIPSVLCMYESGHYILDDALFDVFIPEDDTFIENDVTDYFVYHNIKYIVPDFKRKISFIDNEKIRVKAEITIKDGRFTTSYDRANAGGQTGFSPRNEPQQELLDIWKKWHLNDLNAGTPIQQNFLEMCKYKDYRKVPLDFILNDAAIAFGIVNLSPIDAEGLNSIIKICEKYLTLGDKIIVNESEYFVEFESEYIFNCFYLAYHDLLFDKDFYSEENDGRGYRYGSKWIFSNLPPDIVDRLERICDEIIDIENDERKTVIDNYSNGTFYDSNREDIEFDEDDNEVININDIFSENFNEPEKAIAIAILFKIPIEDAVDYIKHERDNIWKIEGTEYLFGTDEEMNSEWNDDLQNYLDDCILPELPEMARKYFDEDSWKEDAKQDGRAHSLNRYDGSEDYITYDDIGYYAYRQ